MVKKLPYLLSEGLALLCVDLIPKSRKRFYTQQEDVFLEEFITYLWPLNLFMVRYIYIVYHLFVARHQCAKAGRRFIKL